MLLSMDHGIENERWFYIHTNVYQHSVWFQQTFFRFFQNNIYMKNEKEIIKNINQRQFLHVSRPFLRVGKRELHSFE